MKLDHIGIAVRSLEAALQAYQGPLGFELAEIVDIPEQKVRVAVLPSGESCVELLQPTSMDSPIHRFLEKRGEGIHHVCFRVDNIDEKIQELKKASMQLIDSASSYGLRDRRIAFLHPKSTHGVLMELVEEKSSSR